MRNPFDKGAAVKWPYRVEYRFLGFWPCGTLVGPRYLKESLRPWVRPLVTARIVAMPPWPHGAHAEPPQEEGTA